MQLSLRSQLVAGVAALGVSAVAVAPVVQPELLPSAQRLSSAVNLAAFANPIAVVMGTVDDLSFNTFDQASLPAPDKLYWPDSFYTKDFKFLFAPGYWGSIPDLVNQFSTGGLSAVLSNISGYVSAASYGLTGLVAGATSAVWNTPFALIAAAGYLATGNTAAALAELQTQIVDPVVQSVSDAMQAVGYVLDNSIANVGTVLANTIPTLLSNVIGTVINGTGYVLQSAMTTLNAVVSSLTTLNFQAAWNGAVNGLLGVDGTLGQISNLIAGVGIIQPVKDGNVTVDTVVIPSLRSDLTSAGQRLGDLSSYNEGGIRNDAFVPKVAASAAAVAPRAAAARAEVTAATDAASAAEVAHSVAATSSSTDAVSPTADVTAVSPTADVTAASTDTAAPAAGKSVPSKHKATRRAANG